MPCEREVAHAARHGGSVVVSQTEGIDHVCAGTLRGGALVVCTKPGNVDNPESFSVFGFGFRLRWILGIPLFDWRGGAELVRQGIDGLGL